MSIWVRAICTKSLGELSAADLRQATANADFLMMAEMQELDDADGKAAERALRFEGPDGPLAEAKLYYRAVNPDGLFIAVSRSSGAEARGEADELLQRIEHRDDEGGRRLRDVLARAVENVAFCLKQSDYDRMGMPIAWHTAMWLAAKGEGVVEIADDWWDPVAYARI
jgi:hypothetical protein